MKFSLICNKFHVCSVSGAGDIRDIRPKFFSPKIHFVQLSAKLGPKNGEKYSKNGEWPNNGEIRLKKRRKIRKSAIDSEQPLKRRQSVTATAGCPAAMGTHACAWKCAGGAVMGTGWSDLGLNISLISIAQCGFRRTHWSSRCEKCCENIFFGAVSPDWCGADFSWYLAG